MIDRAETVTGGCLCGNIKYRSVNAPVFVSHCHCQRCRRHSGALFLTHAGLPLDGFTWLQGEPTYWHSSKAFERGFCANCGSTVAGRYLDEPNLIVIPIESQVSWLKIDDDLPRYARLSPGYERLDLGL